MRPTERPNEVSRARPPYERPRLVVYGTLHDLTLSNFGGMGKNDMASGPAKTGF